MSTFKGVIDEFPDIRVDFFRRHAELAAPLACFLSHVHSDHLAGLDTLKAPFVYCSSATREILLRLERYPCRLNFQLGILESRKQTYKHLEKLLKPIPLETPTQIELSPGNVVRVTLFDANHCPGSVMFLFENEHKAVLYTGDTRSEPWFVDSLSRSPFLLEYTTGVKTLDCIYLDTSNTENITFPTQADGLKELVQKVLEYPPETAFHFNSWTYGYENVWLALSKALKSRIHIDRYRLRIYDSLNAKPTGKIFTPGSFTSREGPVLVGYHCGNNFIHGCFTEDTDVQIHSCDKAMQCPKVNKNTVWIKPIITRHNGIEIAEVGVGGGGGDLTQGPELELDVRDTVDQILTLFKNESSSVVETIRAKLLPVLRSSRMGISFKDLGIPDFDSRQIDMDFQHFSDIVARSTAKSKDALPSQFDGASDTGLPRVVTFPYSRHSSFPELCHLVSIFKPKDVYPCTVDETEWHEGVSVQAHFGGYCSGSRFRHDLEMRELKTQMFTNAASERTQTTARTFSSEEALPHRQQAKTSNAELTRATEDTTPPRNISASSPGSESQNLRRKHIMDDISSARAKRARLQIATNLSATLLGASEKQSQMQLVAPEGSSRESGGQTDQDPSVNTDQPTSERARSVENDFEPVSFSAFHDESGGEITYDVRGVNQDENHEAPTYFDTADDVRRCGLCGHEMWSSLVGFCTGCHEGQSGVLYYEILDPTADPRPEFEFNNMLDVYVDSSNRREVVGDYLDDCTSAYDSQDGDSTLNEEYEINSFIDDGSQSSSHGSDHDSGDSSDGETDWKQKHEDLQKRHAGILGEFARLQEDHQELMEAFEDVVGVDGMGNSDLDGLDSDMDDDVDENGIFMIVPPLLDTLVTDIVLSQAEEHSQDLKVPEGIIKTNIEAGGAVQLLQPW